MRAGASVDDLRARVARVIPELTQLASRGFPGGRPGGTGTTGRASGGDGRGPAGAVDGARDGTDASAFAVTGVGGSSAPARLLVATFESLGCPARFVPLSAFAEGTARPRPREALCVFSQGLSPNALLALGCAFSFHDAFLFTSVGACDPALASFVEGGGHVLTLPPEHESPTLLRIAGPPIAMLAAALFAHEIAGSPIAEAELARLEPALVASSERARLAVASLPSFALDAPVAFVTSGSGLPLAAGAPIKWLEGLGVAEPPVWDVLEIAHGPFHAFYTSRCLLVALGPRSPLVARLASMLVPDRHALLELPTRLGPSLAPLEVQVAINELFLAAFSRSPRDLFEWPSKGLDAALYGINMPIPGDAAPSS